MATMPTLSVQIAFSPASAGAFTLNDATLGVLELDATSTPTTNLLTHPSFEASGSDVGGFSSNGGVGTTSNSTTRAFAGTHSLLWTNGGSSGTGLNGVVITVTTTPGVTYTFSAYIYQPSLVATGIELAANGATLAFTPGALVTTVGAWARATVTFTALDASTDLHVITALGATCAAGATFFTDAAQLEVHATATTYCDGAQPGCAWTGTANASTSTRGGGALASDPWTDITSYVERVEIKRGSQRVTGPTVRYDSGTAAITLNNIDGRFDPTNLSGPYVTVGTTQVTPMRAIKVLATWAGVTYPLIKVFADSWQVDYMPDGNTVLVTGTDASKVLGNFDGTALVSPVGAGETTGARIGRVLDSAGWSTTDRLIQTGDSTCQATSLASPAWDEILLTGDSEGGQVYVNASGQVQFQQRQDVFTNPRATMVQATFGDAGTATEVPYEQVALSYDDTQFANYVRIARTGGVEQVAQDAASQQLYLTRTFQRTDFVLDNDTDCANAAGQILYQWKDPELRFDSVTVHPNTVKVIDAFPYLLGAAFGDRVKVRRRPLTQQGALVEKQCFVRGVNHTITPLDWQTQLILQSATKWAFFTLNDASLGTLDNNALTY